MKLGFRLKADRQPLFLAIASLYGNKASGLKAEVKLNMEWSKVIALLAYYHKLRKVAQENKQHNGRIQNLTVFIRRWK